MELEIKTDREGFESYIDLLDNYKKKDFPEGTKIDREAAWDLIGTKPSLSHLNPNNDLGDLVFGGIILTIAICWVSFSRGVSFDFSLQTLFCLTAASFYIFNLFRLLQRYELLKKYTYFTKNEGVCKEKSNGETKKCSKVVMNTVILIPFTIIFLYIILNFLIIISISDREILSYRNIYLFFIVINLVVILITSVFKSKIKEIHTYHPKDVFNYLMNFNYIYIELCFWFYTVLASLPFALNLKQLWITLIILPLVMYVRKKLDTAYLLKKYLLEYQEQLKDNAL